MGMLTFQVLVDMAIFRVQFSGYVDISGTSGYVDISGTSGYGDIPGTL